MSRRSADDVSPAAIPANLLPYIYVLDIETQGEQTRLRIRLTGSALDSFFNRPLKDRYLDEFIHGPRSNQVMAGFLDCVSGHEPLWMRQIAAPHGRPPRFVEGIVVPLAPARLYGGLSVGEFAVPAEERRMAESFDRRPLRELLAGP